MLLLGQGYQSLTVLVRELANIGGDPGVLSHTPIRWLVIREFSSRILSTLPSRSYITTNVIIAEVDNQVADLSEDLPDGVFPTPVDTSSIFIGVAQHPLKNHVFGVGSLNSVPSICSRWEGGGNETPSTQSDSALRVELDVVRTKFEASEKAREELELRQTETTTEQQRLKEMYDRQQQEQQKMKERYDRQQHEDKDMREMYEQQQLLLQRILRDRDTPSDM